MAEPGTMKVAELKAELKQLGVTDLRHCVEKDDLVAELVQARQKKQESPPAEQSQPSSLNGRAATAVYNDGLRYGRVATLGNDRDPTGLVLFLHGLGDSCDGWASELAQFADRNPQLLFVLPSAATQPVSMNMGMAMPSWYDIRSLSFDGPEDLPGMQRTAAYMDHLLQLYTRKYSIPPSRVVFGGFSQGACMALFNGLTTKRGAPAGIMSLSGYLGNRNWVAENCVNVVPVFMAHGRQDPVVAFALSKASKAILSEKCGIAQLEYHEYDMGHSATQEEFDAVHVWLARTLPPL